MEKLFDEEKFDFPLILISFARISKKIKIKFDDGNFFFQYCQFVS